MSERLFHYTDIGAVAAILKSRKLWLTNISFLNDSQELIDGTKFISSEVDRKVEALGPEYENIGGGIYFVQGVMHASKDYSESSDLFACSFSMAENLLSQWRAYGNFAIEFSRSELEKKFDLHECVYSVSDKNKLCTEMVKELVDRADVYLEGDVHEPMEAVPRFLLGLGRFKNSYFEAEHEVRVVARSSHDHDSVLYRTRGDYLVPYMESEFPIGSVRAIHIGPIANQELARKSLVSLLRTCGLGDLPVVLSDIPYRA